MTDCTTCSNDYAIYQYEGDVCPVCLLKAQRDELCRMAAEHALKASEFDEPHVQTRRMQDAWIAESQRWTSTIIMAQNMMRMMILVPADWTPPAR